MDKVNEKKVKNPPPGQPGSPGLANLRPILPGEVRNPAGGPREPHLLTIMRRLMEYESTPRAVKELRKKHPNFREEKITETHEVLAKLLRDAKAGSTKAALILIEYLIGRPTQPLAHSGSVDTNPIENLTNEQLDARIESIQRARAALRNGEAEA